MKNNQAHLMNNKSQFYQKNQIKQAINNKTQNFNKNIIQNNHYKNYSKNNSKQHPEKLSALYKYIGKANQLIKDAPLPLNILYNLELQKWNFQLQKQKKFIKKIHNQQESFLRKVISIPHDKQLKNIQKTKRKTNQGYFSSSYNSSVNINYVNFGKLVYDRFPGKIGNLWKINPSQGKGISLATDNFQNNLNTQQQNQTIYDKYEKVCKDQQYQFQSRFQSGNLQKVYKVISNYNEIQKQSKETNPNYYLFLQNDTNTFGYSQWFYFKIKNLLAFQTIQLSILNLRKKNSLHEKGMKIAIFSTKKFQKYNISWQRGGNNIDYFQNGLVDNFNNKFYTLSFSYTFQYANDDVYFALAYPYGYQQMRNDIYKLVCQGLILYKKIGLSVLKNQILMIIPLENKKYNKSSQQFDEQNNTKIRKKSEHNVQINKLKNKNNKFFPIPFLKRKSQNTSNTIDYMQSSRSNNNQSKNLKSLLIPKAKNQKSIILKKPTILIMARVHPCQTMSSFVMQGIIQNLFCQKNHQIPQCKYLLTKFNIRLIPMVNPDGVIHGNSRTSITGSDLNRKWKNPNPITQSQIYSIKKYIQSIKDEGSQIFMILDLHGHSKKQSSFFYGSCQTSRNYHNFYNIKLFNAIMSKMEDNFTRQYSSFYVSQYKSGTARVACSRNYSQYSYTLQTSYLGNRYSQYHFSVQDYKNIGKNLLLSIAYFHQNLNPSLNQTQTFKIDLMEKINQEKEAIKLQSDDNKNDQKSDGSSSNPSLYNYDEETLHNKLISNQFFSINFNRNSNNKSRYGNIKIVQSSRRQSSDTSDIVNFQNKSLKKLSRNFTYEKKKKPILMEEFQIEKLKESTYQLYNFKSRRTTKKKSVFLPFIQDSQPNL